MSDHHPQQEVFSSSQYGSISSSDDFLNEESRLHSTCTQCAANFRYYDYDCSICLERLQDPVWCGQGNW